MYKSQILLLLVLFLSFTACEKDISRSENTAKERVNGKLVLDSKPSGSTIYLNDKITGLKTPDTLFWLDDTTYKVTLKKFLYRDTSFKVNVNKDIPSDIFVDYDSNPKMRGSISCVSDPEGASILLNGELQEETTPVTIIGLIPGEYSLVYQYENCRDTKKDALVKSGTTFMDYTTLIDTSVWVLYTNENSGFPAEGANYIIFDDNNIAWIATIQSGLVRFDGTNWQSYTKENSGLLSNYVNSLTFDNNGKLWIGTNEGVSVYDGSSWESFTSENSELPNDFISHLVSDIHNRIWICTFNGLAQYNNGDWFVYTPENSGIGSKQINFVNLNVRGHVWVGTSRAGIREWNGVNWRTISMTFQGGPLPPQQGPGNSISAISEADADGRAWIGFLPEQNGGIGGLVSVNEENKFNRNYTPLPSNKITAIYVDEATNRKWVGTDSGLLTFVNWEDRIFYVTNNSSFETEDIESISKDKAGNLWFTTTTGGIMKLKVDKLF